MLVRYLYLKDLVSHCFTPISLSIFSLDALLHFDDTDLNVLIFSNKPAFEFITYAQNLLNAFQFTLKALGGDLKLEK